MGGRQEAEGTNAAISRPRSADETPKLRRARDPAEHSPGPALKALFQAPARRGYCTAARRRAFARHNLVSADR
jgi:hypothetical protein